MKRLVAPFARLVAVIAMLGMSESCTSTIDIGEVTPVFRAKTGEQLFKDSALSDSQFNAYSCSTCHSTTDAPSDLIHAGHTLKNVMTRPTFWGGNVVNLLDAINQCLVTFMRGMPLAPDDPKGAALHAFLTSISPDKKSEALPLTVVESILQPLPYGDMTRGRDVWMRACKQCHGSIHTGTGRLTGASIVPEDSIDFARQLAENSMGTLQEKLDIVIMEKVRHGPYFNIGGSMPFFATEMLSDAALGDLLAYLAQTP